MSTNEARKLRQIATKNKTAEAIMTVLAFRKRNRQEPMMVGRFKKKIKDEGFEINDQDFEDVLNELERAKSDDGTPFCKVVRGRGNKAAFILWQKPIKAVGQAIFQAAPTIKAAAKKRVLVTVGGKGLILDFPVEVTQAELETLQQILAKAGDEVHELASSKK